MELAIEILINLLQNNNAENYDNLADLVESQSYIALNKIKAIIQDDSLTDAECFYKIEEIVCVIESLGSNGGNRHDFG